MRPDGRALDIAVVGLGQAGGNLAAEFYRRGYRALALNTAQTDLAALEPGGPFPTIPAERRLYIGLDGYDGAGADPGYGRDCIQEHADRIKAQVQKLAHEADAIVVCAGLGGGTGSSIAALVEILEEEELPLLGLMTLPTESESGLAKVNAVRTVNDIVDADMLGWIFIDNGRIAALNQDVSVADYYAHINSQIVAPLDALNRLNAREELRPIRSFDGEDFRKLLLSGGVLNYGTTELPALTVEEVVGAVRDFVEASDLMPSGFDITRMSYVGLIIEAPEAALSATSIATFEQIHDGLKQETEGAAVYQGTYRTGHDQPITLRVLAATQSLPHRIRQLLADAKREGQVIGDKIREELPTLELGEIQDFDLFRTHTRPSERPRKSGRARASHRGSRSLDDMPMELGASRRARSAARSAEAAEPARRVADAATEAGVLPPPDEAPTPPPRRPGGRRRPGGSRVAPPPGRAAPPPLATTNERPPMPPAPDATKDELEAMPAAPAPSRGSQEIGTDQIDVVAEIANLGPPVDFESEDPSLDETMAATHRPHAPDPDADTGDLPSPDVYDRLVADYLATEDGDTRRSVQRRLEDDSVSDNSVVRYYAVEAMARLGRNVFGNALLAATEDEDEAVRNLAVQALKG